MKQIIIFNKYIDFLVYILPFFNMTFGKTTINYIELIYIRKYATGFFAKQLQNAIPPRKTCDDRQFSKRCLLSS